MEIDQLTTTSGEWLRGIGPQSDIVMSSRIRLARNLADFPFIKRCNDIDRANIDLSLIHISEPTRPERISYAVFCLKKKT